MTEPASSDRATYVVVLRGPSGLHFGPPDGHLSIGMVSTRVGPIDLTVSTRRTHFPGWSRPIRRGLVVEARGAAPSLLEAIKVFANTARSVAVVLALSANLPVGDLIVELAYDATPGRDEREYFQRSLADEPLIPHPGRMVLAKESGDLVVAVAQHVETDRIHRAIAHYADALLQWEPGMETLALASLWMGMEAMTPVALRRELARTGLTREGLAAEWGIELKQLDGEVRRRLLFRQVDSVYGTAVKTSNAYEHSFEGFATVRADAARVRDATADHLRSAILDVVDLDAATRATLLAAPFDRPTWWTKEQYIYGRLIGAADDLAPPDQHYPILGWASIPRELPADEYGDARFTFDHSIAPSVAEGVRFDLDRLDVWGPQPDGPMAADEGSEGGQGPS